MMTFIANSIIATTVDVQLSGQLHRKIEKNKKGKECRCQACFGVCDIVIDIDIDVKSNMNLRADLANGTGRLYITEQCSYAESEFGIDQDIALPQGYLKGTNIKKVVLKTGLYNYIAKQERIVVNGKTILSYGYVDINLSGN